MSFLILPRRFYSQPQGAVEVDTSHPLVTPGSVICNLAESPNNLVNANTGFVRFGASGKAPVGSELGEVFEGSSDYLKAINPQIFNVAPPATFVFRLASTFDSGRTLFGFSDGTTNNGFTIYLGNAVTGAQTDEVITFFVNTGGATRSGYPLAFCSSDRSVLFDGRIHTLQLTTTGTAWKLWLDGKERTISLGLTPVYTYNNGLYGPLSGINNAHLGARDIASGTPSVFFNGNVSQFAFAPKDLSIHAKQIADEPWSVYHAKPRVLYFTTAGGGTNTAAAAGSGSIAVTGSAATALRTFLAAASSASVSVTGSAAIGVAARKSAADAGSIALTGSAATALRTHLAAASSGSIALSGSAANAVRTFLTAAESGAVTVTGSAANGIYTPVGAYNADAQSGAISITGSAASGVYTPVGATNSNAQSGAISVTGSAAIGRHDYLAAAGSGSITVTGSAANAVKSLGAVADSGSIAITGSNALAIRTWLASADAGSITLTGSSANGVKATIGTGTLDPATIAAIADAVWSHSSATTMAVRLAEAWGRLGLDPSKPLISGQTEIRFGDLVMALTGNETSSTLTRAS